MVESFFLDELVVSLNIIIFFITYTLSRALNPDNVSNLHLLYPTVKHNCLANDILVGHTHSQRKTNSYEL